MGTEFHTKHELFFRVELSLLQAISWLIYLSRVHNIWTPLKNCSCEALYLACTSKRWLHHELPISAQMMWIFFSLGVWQHLHLKHISTELKADSANSYMRIPSKCDYRWSLNADFTNSNQLIQVEEFVLPSCILSGSFKVKICQGCALEILSQQTSNKNAH